MPGKSPHDNKPFFYEGFDSPNGTIVPDDVFDILAPKLSEAELRVLLYIVRRTFGFKKNADFISLKQLTDGITTRDGRVLDLGTGMSRKGVISGVKGLLAKGVINVQRRLDERGENQVNMYTLRFRGRVVTQGNYPGYPSTLPPVTFGTPQESVLQDTVEQQQATLPNLQFEKHQAVDQQDVVVDQYNDPAYGRLDLYEMLKDLGVHHHTAGKLLREHDHHQIELMIEVVSERLQNGWTPQESVPAWLVAAIRNHYAPPPTFQGSAQQAQERERLVQQRLQEREADRLATERVQDEFQRQREGRLLALGIEQDMDVMWRDIQSLLRERGQWSIAMTMAYLKSVESGLAILLVPANLRKRLLAYHSALVAAISEVYGQPVSVVLHEMA